MGLGDIFDDIGDVWSDISEPLKYGASLIPGVGDVFADREREKASRRAEQLTREGMDRALAQEMALLEKEREWQKEDRDWLELQIKEAEKREIEQAIAAEQRQTKYTTEAENRAKEFIREQQDKYERIVKEERDIFLGLSEPYRDAALAALPGLKQAVGDFRLSDAYQIRKEEGLDEIEKALSKEGLLGSGAELELKEKFLRNLSAEEEEKQFQKQLSVAGMGLQSVPSSLPSAASPQASIGGPSYTQQYMPTYNPSQVGATPSSIGVPGGIYSNLIPNIAGYQYAAGVNRGNSYSSMGNITSSMMQPIMGLSSGGGAPNLGIGSTGGMPTIGGSPYAINMPGGF